ncbi:MAG: sigma-70 family RNA polymerase sigma factor [Bacteroidales bacterium]|jgi:RNA polymerase sigma-70 factor (ECF subfamily)|nr:sigma-70 family RNA polymerase sigma factor [Bacteroidales bacterium]
MNATDKQNGTNNLEILYEQYKNQIYTLCIRLVYSKDSADDLFGETWTKAAEKLYQLDSQKNAANWIYTICLNIYRKSLRRKQIINISDNYMDFSHTKDDNLHAEDKMIEKETTLQLQNALTKLNDKYRLPIILFYFRDLSYNDISSILKLPLSTVKFRLNQAKILLKKEMEA